MPGVTRPSDSVPNVNARKAVGVPQSRTPSERGGSASSNDHHEGLEAALAFSRGDDAEFERSLARAFEAART